MKRKTVFSWVLNISKDGCNRTSMGNMIQCLAIVTVKKKTSFTYVLMEFPVFQVILHCLLSCHWATEKTQAPSSVLPSIRYLCTLV